uniref:Uncharacterized protein n=1 Tax=Panagrolaimus sp. JU765 TaxID=591449 RepID=A0AC34R6N9_9BILA
MSTLSIFVFFSIIFGIYAITVEDVYKRLLERERNIDNTFTNQFIRPIGANGGELIWPRSYSKPSYLFFDENGAAFNVRADRPTLREILQRTPFGKRPGGDPNDLDEFS